MTAAASSTQHIETLYSDHHGWLRGWLRKKTGDMYQAADLTHDAFEQLLRAPPSNTLAQLREPRAYLTVVAQRVLFNFWRRRDLEQAWLEALATQAEEFAPSAEDRAAALQALEHIDAALNGLPLKTRQVFLLNQLEDMSYREIAEKLGMPVISVRRAMAKAIAACCAVA